MLLIIYVSMKATNFHFKHWKSSIIVSAASFIILSAMAYLFSQVLSPDLELFRSITLPTLVLALAFVVFSRTKYGKRHEY
jgi:predicted Na+-dependent transporter